MISDVVIRSYSKWKKEGSLLFIVIQFAEVGIVCMMPGSFGVCFELAVMLLLVSNDKMRVTVLCGTD